MFPSVERANGNPVESVKWMKKACEKGHKSSCEMFKQLEKK
jgi:TPR repeat protein